MQHGNITRNILEAIGGTPLISINRVSGPGSAEILAKVESLNPGGSVKDRIALAMIEDAERSGSLKPGSVVIEPTSGNTGIGLAMVCAVKGYKCVLTMPETMSLERIYILKAYGAQVILTPGSQGMKGAIKKAEDVHRKTPHSFMPQQFKHSANPQVHRETTAREILAQTKGALDAFVAGVGTGGTITGVGEVLKKHDPRIRVIAVEPEASAVLSGKEHGTHKIQGIGAGFVPDILNRSVIDEIITVSDRDAYEAAKLLAKKEGLFCGPSSGAALVGALKIAKALGTGKRVVTVFPDTGERYFSTTQYFEF
jgi:cysteine synthase A